MKKPGLLLKIFIFAVILPAACNPQESSVTANAGETGSLQITINGIQGYDSLDYKAVLFCTGHPSQTKSWGPDNQPEIFLLMPGYWTIVIEAEKNNGIVAKGGITGVLVKKGEFKVINVSLTLISDDGEDTGDPHEGMLKLYATAASGSAYSVVQSAGFDYESPDQINGGHANESHILQQYDDILEKNVFAFVMHHDVDRNATGDWTRQRVEIKIDHRANSPGRNFCGLGGADEGRSFIHRWKFKLPSDFAVSSEFTHIHQIKNEGGDASQPVVALTVRAINSSDERMQLTYYAPSSSSPVYWLNTSNSLNAYLGQWVQCEERITYSSDPLTAAYSLKIIRIDDNQTLMDYTAPSGIYTWRTGNTYGRPKFGLYRRIFTGNNPGNNIEPNPANAVAGLKDETILYADFEVERQK